MFTLKKNSTCPPNSWQRFAIHAVGWGGLGRLEFDIWKHRLVKRLLFDIRVLVSVHSKAIMTSCKVGNIISSLKLSEDSKSVMQVCSAPIKQQLLKHLEFIRKLLSWKILECSIDCYKRKHFPLQLKCNSHFALATVNKKGFGREKNYQTLEKPKGRGMHLDGQKTNMKQGLKVAMCSPELMDRTEVFCFSSIQQGFREVLSDCNGAWASC